MNHLNDAPEPLQQPLAVDNHDIYHDFPIPPANQINEYNANGLTPLHRAVQVRISPDKIDKLIEMKADITSLTKIPIIQATTTPIDQNNNNDPDVVIPQELLGDGRLQPIEQLPLTNEKGELVLFKCRSVFHLLLESQYCSEDIYMKLISHIPKDSKLQHFTEKHTGETILMKSLTKKQKFTRNSYIN